MGRSGILLLSCCSTLRSTRIREIHLVCRERELPAGWQPRAVFECVILTKCSWSGVDKVCP